MVVDLAVPATPPTIPAKAPATARNIAAEEGENPLEPDADGSSPLDEADSVGTAPAASKHHPEDGRGAAVDRDTDNLNGSSTGSSAAASAAGYSPEDTDSKPCLQGSGERPSSGVDQSEERLDEATSRGARASEGGSVRCDPAMKPNIFKLLPPVCRMIRSPMCGDEERGVAIHACAMYPRNAINPFGVRGLHVVGSLLIR